MMKAIVIPSFGGPGVLRMEDRALPVIGNDDVLIRVMAAGVNRPDIIQREGKYAAPAGTVQGYSRARGCRRGRSLWQ